MSYIVVHPGYTLTGIINVVYEKQKQNGRIFIHRDTDTLTGEGLVEGRFDQGISKSYAKEAV